MPAAVSDVMEIAANRVVSFHYRLSDADGVFIESSEGNEPVAYLHGRDSIVPGLASALRGRRAGDDLTVTVAPEDAYGPRDPSAVQRVPIKHLVRPGKLVAGGIVTVNTTDGSRRATVLKVGRFNVDVDLNHPLAGRTLVFEVSIVDVREATREEIAHGHAHGPGGAHD